jgi:hypothetical protein
VANAAAAGWGGDRFALLSNAEGAPDLVALIAWDTEADRAEFEVALLGAQLDATGATATATLDGRELAVTRLDDTRTVLAVAASAADARALVEAAAVLVAP